MDISSSVLNSKNCVLDLAKYKEEISLILNTNEEVFLALKNIDNSSIKITLKEGSKLHLRGIVGNESKSLQMNLFLDSNADFTAYFADFSKGDFKADVKAELNGKGSSFYWHLASASFNKDKKAFDINVIHNEENTSSNVNSYGVCKDESYLEFKGVSHIVNGAHFSNANQTAKILVFDPTSHGSCKPILKIDDNEIKASHANSLGQADEEQIFYLMSRGLSKSEAKALIIRGYLEPVLSGFIEENEKEEINNLIKENI